jgi:hypothetical protein
VTDESTTELIPAEKPAGDLVILSDRRGVELSSVQACRRELSRIYRKVRKGEVPVSEGTRFAYLLNVIADLVERGELEERLRRIELQLKADV